MHEEKTGSINDEKQIQDKEGGRINRGRHQAQCTICKSPYRQHIDEEWINWCSPYDLERLRYQSVCSLSPRSRL